MSRRLRHPPADPDRKARFREEARDIVAKDRDDRNYGRVVDTAGAIARALERADKQGFADAQDDDATVPSPEPPKDGPLEWGLIPPRPRTAFWSGCLFIFGRHGDTPRGGSLEPDMTERGTAGWRLVVVGYERKEVMGETPSGRWSSSACWSLILRHRSAWWSVTAVARHGSGSSIAQGSSRTI